MSECEAAACLIIALIIDDDDKKTRNKKVDTAKRGGRDVFQPCSGVIDWGYKDIQGNDENELRII